MAINTKKEHIIETLKNCFNDMLFDDFEIYLFGSWVFGEPNKYSDIDILIATENETNIQEKVEIERKIREILKEKNVQFDEHIDISIKKKNTYPKYVNDRWHLVVNLNINSVGIIPI